MATDPSTSKSESRKKLLSLLILGGLILIVLGAVSYTTAMNKSAEEANATLEDDSVIEEAMAEGETVEEAPSADTLSEMQVAAAAKERILGDSSAPIKITEHASLTCGHCASFHLSTFPTLKEKYIDTGKAYLVYSDFPLNAPALHASMVARCISGDDNYFAFLGELFKEQAEWAGDVGYVSYLKAKAAKFGMSADRFQSCIGSEALQTALLSKMEAVQKLWSVSSTPSFVINNQVVISGALGYEDFDKRLQDAMKQINGPEADDGEPVASEPKLDEGE